MSLNIVVDKFINRMNNNNYYLINNTSTSIAFFIVNMNGFQAKCRTIFQQDKMDDFKDLTPIEQRIRTKWENLIQEK